LRFIAGYAGVLPIFVMLFVVLMCGGFSVLFFGVFVVEGDVFVF
jgi:hypothetical protein